MSEQIAPAVAAYFEAVNADRFGDLRDLFVADVVMEMAGSAPRVGVDAALAYYPLALASLPVHHDEPVSVMTSPDGRQVAVEIAFRGTTDDGRQVAFTAVDLFDLDDTGRIARLRSIYDTKPVVEQLRPTI